MASASKVVWGFPTKTWFGHGSVEQIAEAVRLAGGSKALIVTDPGLSGLPMIADMNRRLQKSGLGGDVFDRIGLNPSDADVNLGVGEVKKGGYDCVVAVGGGSALDCGKAIAFMANQTQPVAAYEDVPGEIPAANLENRIPVVAVPTTAGTGSEFGRASVITDTSTHRKIIVFHPSMMPDVVVLDPVLTVSLPRNLTAATGVDALSHSVESLCSPAFHPMADGLATQAIRMIHGSLIPAWEDGSNLEARSSMLVASAMSCITVQKGLGATHALAHAVGGIYGTHHGLLINILLPHVLRRNFDKISGRLSDLAYILHLDSAEAFVDWVEMLGRKMGLPRTLREVGVESDAMERLAEIACRDPSGATNPVPFDMAYARQVLSDAF